MLLVHQRHGKWSLPGGRCYASERPVTALRRELREEIRFELPMRCRPDHCWHIRRPWRKRRRHAEVWLFRLRPDVLPGAEIDAARWFALESLPEDVSRTVQATIREYLRLRPPAAVQVA